MVEASEKDRSAAVDLLARRLLERFGAPDLAAAKAAAEEELAYAASLSDHAEGMVIALARRHESGDIREAFRTLAPGVAARPHRLLAFVEDKAEEEAAPVEEIDLLALGKEKRP